MAKKKAKTREKNIGAAWHVHHDKLVEYCTNYKERARFIKECKPKSEIKIRLRHFRFVKGKLPRGVRKALKALQGYNWKDIKQAEGLLHNHRAEIEALHAKECRNCPWNGRTLFFRRKRKKKK